MNEYTPLVVSGRSTPWHIWVVGLIGILWNGFGATDFLMTNLNRDMWFEMMGVTADQAAMMDAMPAWMHGAWFAGTWGALLGAVAILFRSRWAVYLFWVSIIGFLISVVHSYILTDNGASMGQQGYIMNGVIFLGAVFFLWYSITMARRGILR